MNNELVNVLNDLDEIKTDKSAENIMQVPSFFPEQFKYDTGIAHVVAADFSAESKLSINKTAAKEYLKEIDDISVISCCHKEVNYSLQIK